MRHTTTRLVILLFAAALLWVCLPYFLGLSLPFLLGLGLAVLAEPSVRFLQKGLHLPRFAAVGIGISGTLVLSLSLLVLLCSFLIKELGILAEILPDLETAVRSGVQTLEDWLLSLISATPDGIRPLLTRTILGLSGNSSSIINQALGQLPRLATSLLGHLSSGVVGMGTALLSAFLISGRLPQIKNWLIGHIPESWKSRYLPTLRMIRVSVISWLKAQAKLTAMTFLIVTAGLFLLGVSHASVWALGIAMVDAIPLLGTGLILLPWALISLVRGNSLLAAGLLAICGAATLCRTVCEPRLLGKQLGLDPLLTLISLYIGYRFWGIFGMIFSPLLTVTLIQMSRGAPPQSA